MEEQGAGFITTDIVKDSNENLARDVISMDIITENEQRFLLKYATLDMFVEEGKKLMQQINNMPLNLKDMPKNFIIAWKLRNIHTNARYYLGNEFCDLYLDRIIDEGLFTCLAKALQNLQETWPDLFSKTSIEEEVRV